MSAPMRLERAYFEDLYAADPDPWDFATSAYEREKYAHTLAALEGRRYRRGLEVGCSVGVLTEQLAECCDDLLAVDVSERAVAAARQRLGARPRVRVQRRTLPEEMPDGPFELIVCSEVLYYWGRDLLLEGLARMRERVEPGGSLLAVHWRPRTATYPLQGEEVHALAAEHLGMDRSLSEVHDRYLLDRFDRPA